MEALEALLTRKSTPRLSAPGPDQQQLELLIKAAVRAPDHAALKPWKFVVFAGEGLDDLGQIFADALQEKDPEIAETTLEKAKSRPHRAPMVIAVLAKVTEHPKVPAIEQILSAGSAAQNILIAAHSMGLAGIWRTGDPCFDPFVRQKLGASGDDQIVGFLYLGTAAAMPPIPELDVQDFLKVW